MNVFHIHQTKTAVEELVYIFRDDPPRLSLAHQYMDDLYMTILYLIEHLMRYLLFGRIVLYTRSNKKEISEQLKHSTFLFTLVDASNFLRG